MMKVSHANKHFWYFLMVLLFGCSSPQSTSPISNQFNVLIDSLSTNQLSHKIDSTNSKFTVLINDYSDLYTQKYEFSSKGEFKAYYYFYRYRNVNNIQSPLFSIEASTRRVTIEDSIANLPSIRTEGVPVYFAYHLDKSKDQQFIYVNSATPLFFETTLIVESLLEDKPQEVIHKRLTLKDGVLGIGLRNSQTKFHYRVRLGIVTMGSMESIIFDKEITPADVQYDSLMRSEQGNY